ncbi:hypothetical protein ILYODFUR_018451 [Ilyodon furcidens]|uniref:Uncharacterized protein n=1 Tax=Ilyodon furcidens TaxID=33524 RepID=A0ABV0SQB1_9TELE
MKTKEHSRQVRDKIMQNQGQIVKQCPKLRTCQRALFNPSSSNRKSMAQFKIHRSTAQVRCSVDRETISHGIPKSDFCGGVARSPKAIGNQICSLTNHVGYKKRMWRCSHQIRQKNLLSGYGTRLCGKNHPHWEP